MVEIVFFNAENAPLDDLSTIHKSSFFESWDRDTFDAFLTSFGTAGFYILENGLNKGFILYRQAFSDAEILTFCVMPDSQDKGFGFKLINAMLDHLTKPGKCFLEVSDKNKGAVHLYQKCGFKTVHIRKDYYGKGDDAYMMMIEV
jgi:ribosomal-protein-alanine N-acetyltransferase